MTAFRFYTDAQCGVEIRWPGEVWTYDHIAQELPDVNTERAA